MIIFCNTYLSVFIFFSCVIPAVKADQRRTRSVEITAEEEKLRDPEGYLAIKSIHAILDEDQSGSIDRFESHEFLSEDLKYGDSESERRENVFHGSDESITVEDLWQTWFQSEERGWDQKQVVDWLINSVKLPQYSNNFLNGRIIGMHLPRMAVQNSTFLITLGVKSYVHRQKLQLKALDLVLFGFQDFTSPLKDIALAGLAVMLVTVLIIFKTHKSRSKKQMEELSSRLNKLQDMEIDFAGVEQNLIDNEKQQSTVQSDETGTDFEAEKERRLMDANGFDGLHFSLQNLLRRTYEIESTQLNQQKLECLHEMREAKELVDKMRRKQTSIVNSLKLATGATSGTDDIDTKIFNLKTRMEKIKLTAEECMNRWAEIESMCGFSITGPFGVAPRHILDPNTAVMDMKMQAAQPVILPAYGDYVPLVEQNQDGSYQRVGSWGSNLMGHSHNHLQQFLVAPQLSFQQQQPPHKSCSEFDLQSENTSLSGSIQNSIARNRSTGNRLKQFFKRKNKLKNND